MTTTKSDALLPAQGIEAPRSGRIDPKYLRSGSSKSGSFEMAAWVFMRVSGAALVVLIFVHLAVNLLVGEGIHQIDFGFVAGKWANPVWQFWDLAMLWLAMLHGGNGMRTIINDYAEKDSTRMWLKSILYLSVIVIIVLGTMVIFTFEPCLLDNSGQLLESSPSFCQNV
ncbi:succinate dehydrogenase hydrophobic membrane anchor subunit [Nesterenkonia sp. LB17]|uniref:succinate dehydrogenase hydrophobic membrane anchor subunit n=1 Tax=unclassified Nesterenkonia TaxID=2629769 RepID=UPI001F4C6D90|nr:MULTISPECIES: succinate dehydrogenase hydrophobic membrane anchor subunit [unclassified Nesterenkonia]MCH8560232.1 succinate dehydrogenase hydrophobic membrane anchor subunit [Nesterenkonia sp. DZ6]MCH8563764.1 succinate dehydrogenase hydrophobic membrane anchor subunit [Nesterenkonia sp. YGD6]MCH8565613.1 succinate dehydrogenase hydrophobic membrane anchor subunit [Nesterenkonia sp. LB17]MCH8571699.1 succinate dehydrogenase hydrophobic membrane anchor subunit [Nesterenkonia sp. AY15]